MRRAITLAGGGPAAGLHLGALERLAEAEIQFDVWALSCIGAWVGVVYHQCDPGKEPKQAYQFFYDNVFRDDRSYSKFPINTVFGPDLGSNARAVMQFILDPGSYRNIWLPDDVMMALKQTVEFFCDPKKWNDGDFNHWMLDQVLAVNPFSRFLTSLMCLSPVNGLSRIYYPDSSFLKSINFNRLREEGRPFIYHNAWNLDRQKMFQFSNHVRPGYKPMTAQTLCACSALPYIEETVEIDGETYCEGALIDTVNFKNLLHRHRREVDEIWVSRIVDKRQVKAPKNIAEALGNLCMLFAGALGDDDVKLFKFHAQKAGFPAHKIIEIPVSTDITFEWTHENLERGRRDGREAVERRLAHYKTPSCVRGIRQKRRVRLIRRSPKA